MNQNTDQIIERVKKHAMAEDGNFGVVACVCKTAQIDEGANNKNDIVVVMTTSDIDLSDEVVVPGGMDMGYLLKNRNVFADHEYDIEHTVGWMREDPKPFPNTANQLGWKCRIGLIPENPIANAIKAIIKHTGKIGASIGFRPIERGAPTAEELEKFAASGQEITTIIRSASIFEFSLTSLPCNVACQSKTVSVVDVKMAESVERLVTLGTIDRASAAALGVPGVTAVRKSFPVEQSILWCGNGTIIVS